MITKDIYFEEGAVACVTQVKREDCPYSDDKAESWLAGWDSVYGDGIW